MIDAKSPFTASHSQRVAEIADGIAAVLGFDADERQTCAGPRSCTTSASSPISNRILDKPGKLTDEEFRAIQTHPVHTLAILERAPCFAALAELAANHHEKLDGSGYPRRSTPPTSTCRCGCSRSPTSTRRSPQTALPRPAAGR